MSFLNHIRILPKIMIIVVILMVPSAYLLYTLLVNDTVQIQFSDAEVNGSDHTDSVQKAIFLGAQVNLAKIRGDANPTAKFDEAIVGMKKALEGSPYLSQEAIKAIDDAQTMEFKLDRLTDAISEVADKSNLTLDPDVDTYYLMDIVVFKEPNIIMEMADLHADVSSAIHEGKLTPEMQDSIVVSKGRVEDMMDGLKKDRDKSFAGNTDGVLRTHLATDFDKALDASKAFFDELDAFLKAEDLKNVSQERIDTAYLNMITAYDNMGDKSSDQLRSLLQKRVDKLHGMEIQSIIITVALFALAMLVLFMVTGSINKPLRVLVETMGRLAKGELDVEIPGGARRDEIGDISRAVVGIKDSVAERSKKEQETLAIQRKEDMNKLADRFETGVGGVVETVSSAATELRSSSENLTVLSDGAAQRATAVAAATEEATASVTNVAHAAEQLLAAINEIARKVEDSANTTREAVERAESTNTIVSGLSEAAKKIDNVVKLIQDIAWQTNLLALNATIEAARAGDAGKGFAVVAQEVKSLADQTSKATVEISDQIAAMQANSNDAVKAIRDISETISNINAISQSIAAAVEEQSASTREITDNVQQTSIGVQEVSRNITALSTSASESGEASRQVLGASDELSTKAEQLRMLMDNFIHEIRKG